MPILQLGHLLKIVNRKRENRKQIQAHNYAEPGNTVEDDLSDQLEQFFKQYPGKSGPHAVPPLGPGSTLYGRLRVFNSYVVRLC